MNNRQNTMAATRKEIGLFCVMCAAYGSVVEGEFVYRHTASGGRALCRACWDQLHEDWLKTADTIDEVPFDCYADWRVENARALCGNRAFCLPCQESDTDER